MASLQQRGGGWYHLLFRYQGRQYSHALKTKDRREAEAHRGAVDRVLIRLRNRELPPPPADTDPTTYLLAGGRVVADEPPRPAVLTLGDLGERYIRTHADGALEPKTLAMLGIHFRHLARHFGERCAVAGLTTVRMQEYLSARAHGRGKAKGRRVTAVTIRKDVAALRAAWNWALRTGLLSAGPFPGRGLIYPKTDEKPAFQTWAEIERKVARGGLTPAEVADLWAGLFLTRDEVGEFLAFARRAAVGPHLYPMLAFAAHTGARRSELIRMRVDDADLDAGFATIRERKKNRGVRTTRRVPLSGFLTGVLKEWLGRHPGGPMLFARVDGPTGTPVPLSPMAVYDHFRRLVDVTKWAVLRGWHALRHSFISICAADGVDQRVLQTWVGHLSAATHKRYTHLIPGREREIIGRVFG
jgi:integrase